MDLAEVPLHDLKEELRRRGERDDGLQAMARRIDRCYLTGCRCSECERALAEAKERLDYDA